MRVCNLFLYFNFPVIPLAAEWEKEVFQIQQNYKLFIASNNTDYCYLIKFSNF